MSVEELMSFVHEECKKMGCKYVLFVQEDDKKDIDGVWDVSKDTTLHSTLQAALKQCNLIE